ncbi:hypothetical protein GBA52_007868 [Prunus armeniaca]|nr:hypothetical protein GBA52_007868 [Prunus armeniaca]
MDRIPDADMLRSMRILNMVIQETLRLYAPSMFVGREALDDIELNGIRIPKRTNILIPIPILHRLPDIWGPDALDFNPKRFEHGILGACKFPQAYMPFGVGARICLGQHLAMTELKKNIDVLGDISRDEKIMAPSPLIVSTISPNKGSKCIRSH